MSCLRCLAKAWTWLCDMHNLLYNVQVTYALGVFRGKTLRRCIAGLRTAVNARQASAAAIVRARAAYQRRMQARCLQGWRQRVAAARRTFWVDERAFQCWAGGLQRKALAAWRWVAP